MKKIYQVEKKSSNYSLTHNFRDIKKIYKMTSWEFLSEFYTIIPISK